MSGLQEQLDRIRARFAAEAPEDALAVIQRTTEELRGSGILSRMPAPGDPLPPFELPDTEGKAVRSEELLAKGSLVLTFYRGVW
jgi:hypothetical protein